MTASPASDDPCTPQSLQPIPKEQESDNTSDTLQGNLEVGYSTSAHIEEVISETDNTDEHADFVVSRELLCRKHNSTDGTNIAGEMEISYATHRLNREDSNRTQLTDPPCVYNALPTTLRTNTKLGEVEEMETGTSKQKQVGHNEDNQ
jgi:hypothetical protein